MKISILGGGNMGGAIALGAINAGVVEPSAVTISHLSEKMKPLLKEHLSTIVNQNCNPQAIVGADFIVVAVKPWYAQEVLGEIAKKIDRKRQAIVSVIAGLSFEQMDQMLQSEQLGELAMYRVIPNTAISIGKGVSIISSHNSTAQQLASVEELFGALGSTFVVDEPMMSPLTSLSSCGIAFALRFLDAAAKGGVEVGIDPALSLEVTLQTMVGAIALLNENKSQPQAEIDKVTTKGGITLKGLEAMEREGFSHAMACAMKESR